MRMGIGIAWDSEFGWIAGMLAIILLCVVIGLIYYLVRHNHS